MIRILGTHSLSIVQDGRIHPTYHLKCSSFDKSIDDEQVLLVDYSSMVDKNRDTYVEDANVYHSPSGRDIIASASFKKETVSVIVPANAEISSSCLNDYNNVSIRHTESSNWYLVSINPSYRSCVVRDPSQNIFLAKKDEFVRFAGIDAYDVAITTEVLRFAPIPTWDNEAMKYTFSPDDWTPIEDAYRKEHEPPAESPAHPRRHKKSS